MKIPFNISVILLFAFVSLSLNLGNKTHDHKLKDLIVTEFEDSFSEKSDFEFDQNLKNADQKTCFDLCYHSVLEDITPGLLFLTNHFFHNLNYQIYFHATQDRAPPKNS